MTGSTAAVGAAPAGAPADPQPGPGWNRTDQRILNGLVVALVLLQRIGVPLGETAISVTLPITLLCVGALLYRGRLVASRLRVELYLLAMAACVATTAVVSLRGRTLSITSLELLVVVYLPWVLRIQGEARQDAVRGAARTFVWLMAVLALVGVAQLSTQLAGVWQYQDFVREFLPRDLVLGGFNTDIPLFFGSPTFKANAFVMLEPSVLSQYCALALLIGILLRMRAWRLLVLVAGLASAVSGTGVVLLAIGGLLLLVRSPRSVRPGYAVAGAVALAVVLATPVAPLLLDRTGEVSQHQSSGYSRFVAPYLQVREGLSREPVRYAVGAGPGNADRLLVSSRTGTGPTVLYSILPKALFEYGLVAGGLLVLFLLGSLFEGAPLRVLPGALAVMLLFLNGALLQPQLLYLAWVFTGLGAADRRPLR